MSETVSSEFEVEGVTSDDLWLKDLSGGPGLAVAVERNASEYSPSLERSISSLKEGDLIKATLESQNDLNTEWHIKEITKVSTPDRRSAIA